MILRSLLLGSLLLATTLPLSSWDAGPKTCTISPCSAGAVEYTVLGKAEHFRSNTHLWIVVNALELLEKDPDDNAKAVAKAVKSCSPHWEQGLWDADDGKLAETGGAYGTHFYNASIPDPEKAGFAMGPDGIWDKRALIKKTATGTDMHGEKTQTRTYTAGPFGGHEMKNSGNARTHAKANLAKIGGTDLKSRIAKLANPVACRELGLALHYMTDMTQPMHSSSFSALQTSPGKMPINIALHGAFEYYAGTVQAKFPATSMKWDHRMKTMPADDAFQDAAVRANAMAPGLMHVLTAKKSPTCKIDPAKDMMAYDGWCFVHDPGVDAYVGKLLTDAYQSTAGYMYAAINGPPGPEKAIPTGSDHKVAPKKKG
jgi:hypothetical protein